MTPRKKLILAVMGAAVLLGGGYFAYERLIYVSTDNAQIGAHVTMLSSRVNGTIQKVLVEENQKVKAGDVTLPKVDTSDLSNASASAEAQADSLEARFKEAEVNLRRAKDLFQLTQAISRERYDSANATFKELEGKLKAAQSDLEQAKLNISYTKIVAPSDGTIARKSVEEGQYVPAGQPLFGFVRSDERWVVANFKETDLADIALGKKVKIRVDAVSDKTFSGEVESISPSTGSTFTLLPPDNATGNFTKVVQRIPVRIKLKDLTCQ